MKPIKILPLLFIIVLASSGSFSEAAERRVCSKADLDAAISAARPGDEILMCAGEWRNLDLLFEGNGSASAPITLRADIPGKTVVTGKSGIRMAGSYLTVSGLRFEDGYPLDSAVRFAKNDSSVCNNCRLTESSFIDFSPPIDSAEFNDYQFYVRLHGRNNRVDHNYFTGKHSVGQVLKIHVSRDQPDAHRVDHNFFGHRIPQPTANSGEAIQVGSHDDEFASSQSVIESNYFYRSNGEFEIISVKASNVIVRRNTFDRCEGSLSLRHGNGSWVDGNTFLGHRDDSQKVSGIRVAGEDHIITNNYLVGIKVGGSGVRGGINLASGESAYSIGGRVAAHNVLVAFNTIVDSDRSISIDGKEAVPPSDIIIANNIISSTYGPLIAEDVSINNARYSNNLVFGSSIGVDKSGFIVADPKLDVVDGIHRISSDSPARDSADGSFQPTSFLVENTGGFKDIDAQERIGALDIGADELVAAAATGPLKMCDAGPRSYRPEAGSGCGTADVDDTRVPNPPKLLSATD